MSLPSLEGPVFPVVTPFRDEPAVDYPVDYAGLKRYVDYLLDHGARNIMVASATSRFAQLTEEEIRHINRVVIQATASRGLAIASTGIAGSTALHVETARLAEADGAPMIACEYPWRYQSKAALAGYFQAILAGTRSIGLVLHVTPGRSELGGQYRYDLDALEEILSLPRVVGMKEAAGETEHSRKIWRSFAAKTSVIVAGQASRTFLEAVEFGVSGYFVGTGNLVPEPSLKVFELAQKGQLKQAWQLVEEQELPFLDKAKGMGWHAALKAGLAELGLMNDTERPPMVPVAPEQRAELAAVMKQCGWI